VLDSSGKVEQEVELLTDGFVFMEGKEYDLVVMGDGDEEPDRESLDTSRLAKGIAKKRPRVKGSAEVRYTVCFVNYVGEATILGTRVRVKTPKLRERAFEEMLGQISKEVAGLPFHYNSPVYQPFEMVRQMPKLVLYHSFVYLRYVMTQATGPERLSSCIYTILSAMRRDLERRVVSEDIALGRADPSALEEIVRSPANLVPVHSNSPAYELAVARSLVSKRGVRHVPMRVSFKRSFQTLDTAENRFVKYFLECCRDIVKRLSEVVALERQNFADPRIGEDCDRMEKELSYYLSLPPFKEIGPMRLLPSGSTVIQRQAGYRELFAHFCRLNLGAEFPISEDDMARILENKDIATLYEYWCFFKVAHVMRQTLGEPASATPLVEVKEEEVIMKYGPCLRWYKDGTEIELSYNREYPSRKVGGSYSVPLRPDISVRIHPRSDGLTSTYLFDAKFKLDSKALFDQFEGKDEEDFVREEGSSRTFVAADIYKMHTYRDAIDGVKAAFVLYPGKPDEFMFYETGGVQTTKVEEIGNLSGVGAIGLRPELANETVLEKVIRRMVSDVISG